MWSVMIMRSTMRLVGKLCLLFGREPGMRDIMGRLSPLVKEEKGGESLLPGFVELNNTALEPLQTSLYS